MDGDCERCAGGERGCRSCRQGGSHFLKRAASCTCITCAFEQHTHQLSHSASIGCPCCYSSLCSTSVTRRSPSSRGPLQHRHPPLSQIHVLTVPSSPQLANKLWALFHTAPYATLLLVDSELVRSPWPLLPCWRDWTVTRRMERVPSVPLERL